MPEKLPGSPEPQKKSTGRLKTIVAGAATGYLFGGLSWGISHLLTDEDHSRTIGVGVGVGFAAAGVGASLSHHSMEEAELYKRKGQIAKARMKLAQAITEASSGFGTAGALPGIADGNPLKIALGAGIGAVLGGTTVLIAYQERTKPYPQLEYPEGVEMDTSFPEMGEGIKYPPVFRAASLEGFKKFREVNKRTILNWVHAEPPTKKNDPNDLLAQRLSTAIVIIPDIQHFPIDDPEGDDMKLRDRTNSQEVQLAQHTFMFWPHSTCFEDSNRLLNKSAWNYWKEKSWKHGVVLLAQYQKSGFGSKYKVEEVVDNYWLVDISTKEKGIKKKTKEDAPQGQLSPVPLFNHSGI